MNTATVENATANVHHFNPVSDDFNLTTLENTTTNTQPYVYSADELRTIEFDPAHIYRIGVTHVDKRGNPVGFTPLCCIENLRQLLRACNFFVRYNLITRQVELLGTPIIWGDTSGDISNAITNIVDIAKRSGLKIKKEELYDFLEAIGRDYLYNPVLEFVTKVKWDGVDRLDQLAQVIKSENTSHQLKKLILTKWMLSAVALGCADEHSKQALSAEGMLVFTGRQGLGKTRFLLWLTNPITQYFLEGAEINPTDKDSISKYTKHWIVELGELETTLKKSEIGSLKAMLTSRYDIFRPVYGRKDIRYKRRTVFSATINHRHFLEDKTGSRRFWVIDVDDFNFSEQISVYQVWAQIYQLYLAGESWRLNNAERDMLALSNSQYQSIDTFEDALFAKFDFDVDKSTWNTRLTTAEIFKLIGIEKPTTPETKRLQEILNSKNVFIRDLRRDGIKGRFWVLPPVINRVNSIILQEFDDNN